MFTRLTKKSTRKLVLTAASAGLILGLAACGGNGSTDTDTAANNSSSEDTAATADTKTDAAETTEEKEYKLVESVVDNKLTLGNPVVGGLSDDGTYIYGGDPSAYVDGDTVYLYTGHDMSTDKEVSEKTYHIPEYFCYSSTDMINWTSHGVVMDMSDVDWTRDSTSAWASQVTKHFDPEQGKDLYYLYYCSWDAKTAGKQSIGVAVSETPTGPFVDIGEPLVRGVITKPQTNNWNDIDPTVWVDADESGQEHRYLAWGNSLLYICELNEDMISVKDQNGDGEITCGVSIDDADIVNRTMGIDYFTEAPWIYRRQDESGNYYGDYYIFYAYNWREGMGYVTTDDLLRGELKNGGCFMNPTATSNTDHEAVIDFKGKTYFIYHNGSLPGGSGYRRSACITELKWNDDGSVQFMEETSCGLTGQVTLLLSPDGARLAHESFENSYGDTEYPYINISVGTHSGVSLTDQMWVINPGKADISEETYVSIQSENKTGLYLTVTEEGKVVLAQDTDASKETAASQTFKTYKAENDMEGYTVFESVAKPGFYLTLVDGQLTLTDNSHNDNGIFFKIETSDKSQIEEP
ncbi:MAG: family 43 glycosylhydrolase [Eubacterium sp.]|nr:family 43 glycosylhydrolase [Eubacterium sp.]